MKTWVDLLRMDKLVVKKSRIALAIDIFTTPQHEQKQKEQSENVFER